LATHAVSGGPQSQMGTGMGSIGSAEAPAAPSGTGAGVGAEPAEAQLQSLCCSQLKPLPQSLAVVHGKT
jgi:hypothetical protein